MVAVLEKQTYMPATAAETARLDDYMNRMERGGLSASSLEPRKEPKFFLSGDHGDEIVEIPESIYRVLTHVVHAMEAGKAVTIAPQDKELTTQQAADLLGVSRPTVVKLIDDGKLAARVPGKRRRLIRLDDLLAYQDQRREEQYDALFSTSGDYANEEPIEDANKRLRTVRAELAEERSRE